MQDNAGDNDRKSDGPVAAPGDDNKRRAPRRRMLKRGIVTYSGRSCAIGCTIRDISETGAKIQVPDPRLIPDTFELINELDGTVVPAMVAWRRGSDLGVRFTGPTEPIATTRNKQIVTSSTAVQPKPTLRRKPIAI